MVSALDREFATTTAALSALSTSPLLTPTTLMSFHAQASQALTNINADSIVLVDHSGQLLVNTRRAFGTPLPKLDEAPLLQRMLATGKPGVSDLFRGPLELAIVTIGVPVSYGGLFAAIAPERLSPILAEQKLPSSWRAIIADSTGTIVARTHDINTLLGKKVTPDLLQRMTGPNESAFESKTLEGIPVLTAYSRSRVTNWTVALGAPLAELTEGIRQAVFWLIISTCAALAIGLALAWSIGGKIAYSITALVAPARALGSGVEVTVPTLDLVETDEVGKALSKASALLHYTNDALVQSEARLRGIIESALDAIISVDEGQRIVLFNRAAETIFGYPREQVIGVPFEQLLPERFRVINAADIRQFGERGPMTRQLGTVGNVIGLRRNGEEFPIDASISQITEAGQRIYTLILRDITERVRSSEILERSILEREQFVFIASHDLKTPLRAISGYIQLLERAYSPVLDEKAVDLIRRTAKAAQRLDQLTDDLLSYARLDTDLKAFAPVNCRQMMNDVMQLLEVAIQETGASITVGELPETIIGDRTQIVQLFQNLIGNGIKYHGDRPPRVEVSAKRQDDQWVFSVSDNGIGIEAEHHEGIFKIFRRLHTQQDYSGTGIGLSVCRRVVDRHHGKIWVESRLGEGSIFYFTIPDFRGSIA